MSMKIKIQINIQAKKDNLLTMKNLILYRKVIIILNYALYNISSN